MPNSQNPKSLRSPFSGASQHVYNEVNPESGRTLLTDAIFKGSVERVQELLLAGANPNALDKDGAPLHHAVRLGQLEMVRLLLEHGAEINRYDQKHRTPLFEAPAAPCAAEMTSLLLQEGADANIADEEGRIPFHVAAETAGSDVIRLFMQATGNPDQADNSGCTALHRACEKNGPEAVQMLVSAGLTVLAANKSGDTPLHFAVVREKSAVAEYLLTTEAVLLVNAVNLEGKTPLHLALKSEGREFLARQMVLAGADVNMRDKSGASPLFMAVSRGDNALTLFLIQNGADVTGNKEKVSFYLLLRAAILSSKPSASLVVETLLRYNADPNETAIQDPTAKSPLMMACDNGNEKQVRLLLEAGADPNVADSVSNTPLHAAMNKRFENMAALLLSFGADPIRKNRQGITPFDIAYGNDCKIAMERFRKELERRDVSYTPKKPPPSMPDYGWFGF